MGINNAAQQNMNNLPPVVTPKEEPKKPVQQVKPQPVKTTTATPAKPRETTKPATAAPAPSKAAPRSPKPLRELYPAAEQREPCGYAESLCAEARVIQLSGL